MTCTHCGTEIADKAIVCYRCGQATAEARRKPAPPPARGRSLIITLALLVLLFAALFLGQAGTGQVPPLISWTMAALAAIVLAWRVMTRRRR